MIKKLTLALLILPLLLVAPKIHAANWSENAIKAVCIDAIAEAQQNGTLPLAYSSNVSGGATVPDTSLVARVSALEGRMTIVEQLANTIVGLLNQVISMIAGLVK